MADRAYEFGVGRNLSATLARAAREAAGPGTPLSSTQLRGLRRVAREHGGLDDAQRMFLAGLLDADNVRTLARTPIDPGATFGFSLASIRAGMPQFNAVARPRRPPPRVERRSAATRRADAAALARAPSTPLKPFWEAQDALGLWKSAVVGELDSFFTSQRVIVETFRAAARAGKFVQLQDRLDMAKVMDALDARHAVEVGVLGPVTSGRGQLNRRRVEYIVDVTGDFGPGAGEIFVHRLFGAMYADDAVAVLGGLRADARIKTTIALMPSVQELLKRRGVLADAWTDREETLPDFFRSAWESLALSAYAHNRDGSKYFGMKGELPAEYQATLDLVEQAAFKEAFSTSNVIKGALDQVTLGMSSAVTGLVVDTPKGAYHFVAGDFQKAGPELLGLMIMVGTYGIAKGAKVLGARAAGVEAGWTVEYSGPKSKALARLEAILRASPEASAAAAALAELSEAEIEAGGSYVTGNSASAAFVYKGGPAALKALIRAGGDLAAAEAAMRAAKAAAQLPAGLAADAEKPASPAAAAAAESPAVGRPEREARAARLAAQAAKLGRPLRSDYLRKLARTNPSRFEEAARVLEEELADMEERRGDARTGEVADEFREAGKPGEQRASAPPETQPVEPHKSTVRLSHDAGVEGGRAKASEHKIEIVEWDNPEAYRDEYGRGFDDVGRRGADRVILEYKGESSELAPGQMSARWVGQRIAMLAYLNARIAEELLAAVREGKLRGRVYRTTIGPAGRLHTVLEMRMTYERAPVLNAFEARLKELRAAKTPIH